MAEMPLAEGASLGPALEPALREACRGKLMTPIRWFRSDWQRGGGATGSARFVAEHGEVDVVVKLPVGPAEFRWTAALGGLAEVDGCQGFDDACPTPRVFAGGMTLGGYDLGWLVLERLPGVPMGSSLDEGGLKDLLDAVRAFHQRAAKVRPLDGQKATSREPDWASAIEKSREVARRGSIPESQKWNSTLKDVHKHLDTLTQRWAARTVNAWCHGDVHGGNALRRGAATSDQDHAGPCVLIDLALVHAGHWIEDALYLERGLWGRAATGPGFNAVAVLASLRRAAGVSCREDYTLLANTRRVLSAAAAPGLVEREGSPAYLHRALEVIQKMLPVV